MKSTPKRIRRLWQFKIVNRHTLVEFPLVLVTGYSSDDALRQIWSRFDKSIYDVVSFMQLTNPRFMALCAAVFPSLDEQL